MKQSLLTNKVSLNIEEGLTPTKLSRRKFLLTTYMLCLTTQDCYESFRLISTWCNQCSSIKYLFKYIHKGYDRINASIVQPKGGSSTSGVACDEIQHYLDCRYVSPSEACWRIFSFKIHG